MKHKIYVTTNADSCYCVPLVYGVTCMTYSWFLVNNVTFS